MNRQIVFCIFSLTLVGFTCTGSALADEKPEIPISIVYQNYLLRDSAISRSKANEDILAAQVDSIASGSGPQVILSGSVATINQDRADNGISLPTSNYKSENFNLTLKQSLVNIPRKFVEEQYQSLHGASRRETESVKVDRVNMLSEKLAQFLILSTEKEINQRLVAIREEMTGINASRLKAGAVDRRSLLDAQVSERHSKMLVDASDKGLESLAHELKILMNVSGISFQRYYPKVSVFEPALRSFDFYLERMKGDNPKLKQLRLEGLASESAIRAAEGGAFPTLDLTAGSLYSNGDSNYFTSSEIRSNSVGLTVSIPLYTHGKLDAGIREQIARRVKASLDEKIAREELEGSIRSLYLNLKSSSIELRELNALSEILADRLSVEISRRTQGFSTSEEVLTLRLEIEKLKLRGYSTYWAAVRDQLKLATLTGGVIEDAVQLFLSHVRPALKLRN